jgi:hypothetical protein
MSEEKPSRETGTKKIVEAEKDLQPQHKKQQLMPFDAVGVGKIVGENKQVLNWFRKTVELHKVPLAKQTGLAAALLDYANNHHDGKLTLPFLKDYEDYIPSLVEYGTEVDFETFHQIQVEAAQNQWKRAAKEFHSHLAGLRRIGHQMATLLDKHPQVRFPIDKDLGFSIKIAKQVIDRLAEL